MVLSDTPDVIHCQNCGAAWPLDAAIPAMFYFQPHTDAENKVGQPDQIDLTGSDLVKCPKCPLPRLDKAMYRGDSRIMKDNI